MTDEPEDLTQEMVLEAYREVVLYGLTRTSEKPSQLHSTAVLRCCREVFAPNSREMVMAETACTRSLAEIDDSVFGGVWQ